MEVFGAEKFIDGDIQAVAELFDRCDGRRVVSAARNVIKRGLRDAAEDAQAVDRDTSFFAQRRRTASPTVITTTPLSFHKEYRFPLEKINSFGLK